MDLTSLKKKFLIQFSRVPTIIRAPGRVNIIGEHTDYNDGFVLPFSISKAIYFACALRSDDEIHIHADDLGKKTVINSENRKNQPEWVRYFTSALAVLEEDGHAIQGMNVLTAGDIPFGAGISSSSALTCGFLYCIIHLNKLKISNREIVFLASRAENGTGVNGGKMDQFAICMGKKDKALLIDCKDYTHKFIDNNLKNASWYLFNTKVEHNLAETEYNDRRLQCETAIQKINKHYPNIESPRDLNMDLLNEYIHLISKTGYDRLSHVIEENERVHEMIVAIQENDLPKAGNLLYESHESLTNLYQVSCEELDFIVAYLQKDEACIGARMMGGGFGGCVIALIKNGNHDFETLKENYQQYFDLQMEIIRVKSDDGINIVVL